MNQAGNPRNQKIGLVSKLVSSYYPTKKGLLSTAFFRKKKLVFKREIITRENYI